MILELKRYTLLVSITILVIPYPVSPRAAVDGDSARDASPSSGSEESASNSGKWGKLLPLPIFITEPAVGEGLGATLIYFHDDEDSDEEFSEISTPGELSKTGERSKPPPTATGIFAFYTNNDTAGAGIGHSNSFSDDHLRVRAAAAKARINSQIYAGDTPIDFQLDGNLAFADLKTRLFDSGAFFGVSASYFDASASFTSFELLDFDFVDVGLAASLIYDTRDNTILPSRGFHIELIGWRHDEAIGGDFNYSSTRFKGLWFTGLGEKFVLGARVDAGTVDGDPPFFAFPYVRLRGIPALRYQGETASAFELEGRRRLGDRWTVSLFTGVGFVSIGDEQVETDDEIRTVGVGTRWLAFREEDAWVGIDIARGPTDVAVYIQMGSSW